MLGCTRSDGSQMLFVNLYAAKVLYSRNCSIFEGKRDFIILTDMQILKMQM